MDTSELIAFGEIVTGTKSEYTFVAARDNGRIGIGIRGAEGYFADSIMDTVDGYGDRTSLTVILGPNTTVPDGGIVAQKDVHFDPKPIRMTVYENGVVEFLFPGDFAVLDVNRVDGLEIGDFERFEAEGKTLVGDVGVTLQLMP